MASAEEVENDLMTLVREQPDLAQLADTVEIYRAHILELAGSMGLLLPNEEAWNGMVPIQKRQAARDRLSHLMANGSDVTELLAVCRRTEQQLSNALYGNASHMTVSEQTENPHRARTGFLDVSKMVASGLEMLFGDAQSSNEVNITGTPSVY